MYDQSYATSFGNLVQTHGLDQIKLIILKFGKTDQTMTEYAECRAYIKTDKKGRPVESYPVVVQTRYIVIIGAKQKHPLTPPVYARH